MHTFAPASMFSFFALATIPVIIYLIFRSRKQNVAWGAMYILRRLLESQSKYNIWKQYIVLFLRTVVCALIVAAFLWFCSPWAPPPGGAMPAPPPSTHRLLLVDVSQSMDAASGSGTCLDAAFSFSRKVLESGTFPGQVDILPLDGREEPLRFADLPPSDEQMAQALGGIERRAGGADFERGLRVAIRTMRASHYRQKELFILSDFSVRDLQEREVLANLCRSLERMGVTIHALSFENEEAGNFALLDFSPHMDTLLADQPTLFYLTVGYYGRQTTAETWVTIRDSDGETLYEEAVSLAQGEKTLEIPLALPVGEQHLTASLREDGFPVDDQLVRAFRVRDVLRMAVIQDLDLTKGFENPRHWLRLSFSAGGSGRVIADSLRTLIKRGAQAQAEIGKDRSAKIENSESSTKKGFQTTVDFVNSSQVGPDLLVDRDGVIVLDVDILAEDAVAALEAYAARGGLIFLAPGPKANAARLNEAFAPILPALLQDPVRAEVDPDDYASAILEKVSDPILRELESPQHGNISNARFYNHYAIDPQAIPSSTEIILSLSDGSPLLLSRPMGRGSCVLWTAGLGMAWQSMVVHPVYPVFFTRLFNQAAARRAFALNLSTGEPIIRQVEGGSVLLRRPDGEKVLLEAVRLGEQAWVRYDDTEQGGTYLLHPDPEDETVALRYSVRELRRESDYRSLTGEERTSFETTIGSRLFATEAALIAGLGAGYRGSPLAPDFLIAALGLLLLQAYLARRWFA